MLLYDFIFVIGVIIILKFLELEIKIREVNVMDVDLVWD